MTFPSEGVHLGSSYFVSRGEKQCVIVFRAFLRGQSTFNTQETYFFS